MGVRGMVRALPAVLLLNVVAMLGLAGCGCGDDSNDIGPPPDPDADFVGTLEAVDGDELVFALTDGSTVSVRVVAGRTWPLEVGDRYRVQAFDRGDGELTVRMPGGCSSGTISNADGSVIESGTWAWVEAKLTTFVVYGGAALAAVVLLWGLARWMRRATEPVA